MNVGPAVVDKLREAVVGPKLVMATACVRHCIF